MKQGFSDLQHNSKYFNPILYKSCKEAEKTVTDNPTSTNLDCEPSFWRSACPRTLVRNCKNGLLEQFPDIKKSYGSNYPNVQYEKVFSDVHERLSNLSKTKPTLASFLRTNSIQSLRDEIVQTLEQQGFKFSCMSAYDVSHFSCATILNTFATVAGSAHSIAKIAKKLPEASHQIDLQTNPIQTAPPLTAAKSIKIKMADFKGLRKTMAEFVDDPNIPMKLRTLVRKALAADDVDIIRLTNELRKEYLIPDYFDALASTSGKSNFRLRVRPGQESLNALGTSLMNGATDDPRKPYPFTNRNNIMVQDRSLNSEHNDLITLVHELAHIRTRNFIDTNIENLAKRFPEDLIRKSQDGIYEIDEQLKNYIDERFAHEMEFQTLQSTYGSYYSQIPEKWASVSLKTSEPRLREIISDHVSKSYRITDPRITSLRNKKISEILIGGMK